MRRPIPAITALGGAVLATGLSLGLSACAGNDVDEDGGEPVAAVLVSPDAGDIAEVTRAIRELTGASRVRLPDDVFTKAPELVLDRSYPQGLDAEPAGGRIVERPPLITLLKEGDRCIVVLDKTGESETLSGVECVAFTAR